MKIRFFYFLVLLSAFILSACDEPISKPARRQYQLEVKIAYSGNTKPVLSEVSKEAIRSLGLNIPTVIKFSSIDGYQDAERFGRGEIQVDAWLSPSSTLIDTVNQNVSGLGTSVLDCESVFASPVVATLFEDDAKELGIKDRFVSTSLLAKAAVEDKIWMALPDPRVSSTGLVGLYQLSQSKNFNQSLLAIQNSTWSSSVDSEINLKTARGQTKRKPVIIASEQEYSAFGSDFLKAYYFKDGTAWLNYGFCISSSKSLNEDKLRILKAIQESLLSKKWQAKAKELGYRPLLAVSPVDALSPERGVDPLLPSASLKPPRSSEANFLIKEWEKTKRKAATAILLDTSSSMEGSALLEVSGVISAISAKLLENGGKISLIRFSNTLDQNTPFVNNSKYISQRLKSARPIGGSALHDAIKRALVLLSNKDLSKFQKRIIFISDGPDSSSRVHLDDLKKLVNLDSQSEPVIILGVFLTDTEAVPSDTKKFIEDLGGKVFSTKRSGLPNLIDDILGAL